jgi:hypothetical protein
MTDKVSKRDRQKKLVENMRRWQGVETAAIAQTAKIMGASDNPLIQMVATIIQRDSQTHYAVQKLIIDSLTHSFTLGVGELETVWDGIEKHIEIEKRTIELAKDSLEQLDHQREGVMQYLLEYLLVDEEKHDKLLSDLELVKKGMYP